MCPLLWASYASLAPLLLHAWVSKTGGDEATSVPEIQLGPKEPFPVVPQDAHQRSLCLQMTRAV